MLNCLQNYKAHFLLVHCQAHYFYYSLHESISTINFTPTIVNLEIIYVKYICIAKREYVFLTVRPISMPSTIS